MNKHEHNSKIISIFSLIMICLSLSACYLEVSDKDDASAISEDSQAVDTADATAAPDVTVIAAVDNEEASPDTTSEDTETKMWK